MGRILCRGLPVQLRMRIGKFLFAGIGCLGVIACALSAPPSALPRAAHFSDRMTVKKVLLLALDPKPNCDIQVQICMKQGDGGLQKANIFMNTQGFERIEQEGENGPDTIIVDDLDTRTIYDPDRGSLSVGKSPRGLNDFRKQVELILKNYRVTLDRVTLLQRSVYKVLARPKIKDLSKVAIYVDPRSGYVMQTVTTFPNGHEMVFYRTCSLTYLDDIPSEKFHVSSSGPVTTKPNPAPQFVGTYDQAKRIIGFTPIQFRNGTQGFVVEKLFILGMRHPNGLGIQLTNGLAHATIFEFSKERAPKWLRRSSPTDPVMERNGVLIQVMCPESNRICIALGKGL